MYEKQSRHGQAYILRSDSQVQAVTTKFPEEELPMSECIMSFISYNTEHFYFID